jgi:hypothetical protein
MFDRRAKIDQKRMSPKNTPGLLQGMNHALNGDSSERPAKDHDVEAFIPKRKPAPVGNDIPCPLIWGFESLDRGSSHKLGVWIDGCNRCTQPCHTAGEPAFSTSELQDITIGPQGRCLKRSNLVLVRINVKGHAHLPPCTDLFGGLTGSISRAPQARNSANCSGHRIHPVCDGA